VSLRNILIGVGVLLVLALLLFFAALFGAFIGRGSQEEIAEKQERIKEGQKPEPTEKKEEKKTAPSKKIDTAGAPLDVGEPAELQDGSIVTINDLQRGFVFPNNSPRPRAGNEFVLMNITITNTSANPIRVNPVYFKVEDSNGIQRNSQTPSKVANAISTDTVAPYGELTGHLYAEIPSGDPRVKVTYEPG
jgi:Na+-transporting methylmalonyl-CoA/oxaloacetate decarboxylase gamma subunit